MRKYRVGTFCEYRENCAPMVSGYLRDIDHMMAWPNSNGIIYEVEAENGRKAVQAACRMRRELERSLAGKES